MDSTDKIAVLGAGSFGTAFAHICAQEGARVILWGRSPCVVREINSKHRNSRYLKFRGPLRAPATTDLKEALDQASVVVFAVPCQNLREFLLLAKDTIPKKALLVNLAKGVEVGTFCRPSEIFMGVFGPRVRGRYAIISGPTFAEELCLNMPTAAVVAAQKNVALRLQQALSTTWFRLYSSTDVTGVELGGALKNIMAIAVGIAEGLGFGHNTRAGLVTRCLAEMVRIGKKLGARDSTFSGLSGIGDLILTCTGDLSRNRRVGLRLGRGESLRDICRSMPHVAEGVSTTKAVYRLCQKLKLDAPNTEHVYRILYRGMSPKKAVSRLMKRNLKFEF